MSTGRPCSICSHPEREAIDRALVTGSGTIRAIAGQFKVKRSALGRHKAHHLVEAVRRGAELAEAARAGLVQRVAARVAEAGEIEDTRAMDLHQQLGRLFRIGNKLLEACDRFLTDPNDPSRYDLNPRAHELEVTLIEVVGHRKDGTEIVASRKALLSELVGTIEARPGTEVMAVKWRVTDPRRLVLEAAHRLEGQQRWLRELVDKAKGDGAANLVRSPEWRLLRGRIVEAVEDCDSCREKILAALGPLEPVV